MAKIWNSYGDEFADIVDKYGVKAKDKGTLFKALRALDKAKDEIQEQKASNSLLKRELTRTVNKYEKQLKNEVEKNKKNLLLVVKSYLPEEIKSVLDSLI